MADSKNVLLATDTNFDAEVMKQDQLTVVDFWAEWCGPCRMLGPTLEKLADEYTGKIKLYKMNVDENPTVPGRFSIRGIPTVIFFKGGKVVDQIVGNQPRDVFVNAIQRHA